MARSSALVRQLRESLRALESARNTTEQVNAEDEVASALARLYKPTYDALSDDERVNLSSWKEGLIEGYLSDSDLQDMKNQGFASPDVTFADLDVIDSVVRKAPRIPTDMRLYRGVPSTASMQLHAPADRPVMSTSVSPISASEFSTGAPLRMYEVPEGSPGLFIPDGMFSPFDSELEMLLPITKRGRDNFILSPSNRESSRLDRYYYVPPYKRRGGPIDSSTRGRLKSLRGLASRLEE